MASAKCCSSRDPPSPDAEAPRLAGTPFGQSKKLATDHFLSLSVVSRFSKPEDNIALQAIFEDKSEEDVKSTLITSKKSSNTLNAVKSRLQKHLSRESAPTFQDEKAEESDDSEFHIPTKKSSSTLEVVKSKLKIHTSRESGLSKHRSAFGSSEEELERRAELRRIRHKRIQEELSNEEAYDDDAKSITTEGGTRRISAPYLVSLEQNSPMEFEGHDLFPDYDKQHMILLEARGYEVASAMGSKNPLAINRRLSDAQIDLGNALAHSNSTRSRRHSLPGTSDETEALHLLQTYQATRKRSALPPLPPKPLLQPTRLPSIANSTMTRSSWRLSFTSDDRATHLRKLSEGYTLPIIGTNDPQAVDPPPMSKWLKSQGLRASSQAMESSDDGIQVGTQNYPPHSRQSTQDFGGVDGMSEASEPAHLHEMGIPQLLSRDQHSSSSSPQPSIWHRRGLSTISAASRLSRSSRARFMRDGVESVPLSDIIPPSWGKILRPKTSSSYPSEGIRESPQSSRFNLFSVRLGSKDKDKDHEDLDSLKDSEAAIAVPPNTATTSFDNIPTPTHDIPLTVYPRQFSKHSLPASFSENGDSLTDELKLNVTKNRAKASRSPHSTTRSTTTPVSSKFREEFDKPNSGKRSPRKSSILSTFQLPQFPKISKRTSNGYDGADSRLSVDITGGVQTTSAPTPRIGFGFKFPNSSELINVTQGVMNVDASTNLFTGGSSVDPLDEFPDSAQAAWKRAVKMHGESNAMKMANSMKVPNSKRRSSSVAIGLKTLSLKLPRKRKTERMGAKSEGHTEGEDESLMRTESIQVETTHQVVSEPRGLTVSKRGKERDERVMNAWEHELEAVEREAKDKSKEIVPRGRSLKRGGPTGKLSASWCRYPSHTRDERTQSAGASDRVISQDFAVKSAHSASHDTEYYYRDRKHHHPHNSNKDHKVQTIGKAETLPAKLRRNLVYGLYRLRAGEGNEKRGTKSVVKPGGSLEYPELEILPSLELAGLEGLDLEIGQAMRVNERERRRQGVVGGGDGSVDSGDGADEEDVESDVDLDGASRGSMSIADPSFYGDCVEEDETASEPGDLENRVRKSLQRVQDEFGGASEFQLVEIRPEELPEASVSASDDQQQMDRDPAEDIVNEVGDLEERVRKSLQRVQDEFGGADKFQLVEVHPEDHEQPDLSEPLLQHDEQEDIEREFGMVSKEEMDAETVRDKKVFILLSKYFKDKRSSSSGIVDHGTDHEAKELVEGRDLNGFIQTDFEEVLDDQQNIGKEFGVKATFAEDEETVRKSKKLVDLKGHLGFRSEESLKSTKSLDGSETGGEMKDRERKVSLGTMALKSGSRVNLAAF